MMRAISQQEFAAFQRLIYDAAGIQLSDGRKDLVIGRLGKRLAAHGLRSYHEYLKLLTSGEASSELQMAVDLLTTNETYFFREPSHFEFLRAQLAHWKGGASPFRVWSAATSSGEEAYSIAMVLEDRIPGRWEVLGSDISSRMLESAGQGRYPMQRIEHFPPGYLQRFCLKGIGGASGMLLVDQRIRERVRFRRINLNVPLPQEGHFDVIFLRNVLIYFNAETRRRVVKRLMRVLRPGGYFIISHSESLTSLGIPLEPIVPSIYSKAP